MNFDATETELPRRVPRAFRRISGWFKDAVGKAGGNKRKTKTVLSHLDDVDHKIPIVGGAAAQALDRIEKLLIALPALETSDSVKLRAAQRAIDHRAPFHHDKNSIADALIIEMYDECVRAKASAGTRFAFVTHNKHDFSLEDGNHKLPHADLSTMFSRVKSGVQNVVHDLAAGSRLGWFLISNIGVNIHRRTIPSCTNTCNSLSDRKVDLRLLG